mmetsp:Transcript_125481/g.351445  ORF Transcript_125481/g.351445 Transcript_125481/m.351445 type:complete len:212 (+) Transcript_125481:247-882(+)
MSYSMPAASCHPASCGGCSNSIRHTLSHVTRRRLACRPVVARSCGCLLAPPAATVQLTMASSRAAEGSPTGPVMSAWRRFLQHSLVVAMLAWQGHVRRVALFMRSAFRRSTSASPASKRTSRPCTIELASRRVSRRMPRSARRAWNRIWTSLRCRTAPITSRRTATKQSMKRGRTQTNSNARRLLVGFGLTTSRRAATRQWVTRARRNPSL